MDMDLRDDGAYSNVYTDKSVVIVIEDGIKL